MKHGMHYLGIKNLSGPSCYISSGIQLLQHAIHEDDKKALIQLSQLLSSSKDLCKDTHEHSSDGESNGDSNGNGDII